MRMFLLGICLAAGTLVLVAQDNGNFPQWMKTINGQVGALRKNEAKTGPEAVAAGEKLLAVYTDLSAYWAGKAEDAEKLSNQGKEGATALIAAAKAGDSDKANAAFKEIGGTCRGCHEAHREKTDSGFKIK